MISIVVPAFNEQAVLEPFHRELKAALASMWHDVEVIYVDDGSHDGTPEVLRGLHAQDPHVGVVSLSRNFGKEAALAAGMEAAAGDCVITIDADLQHPPTEIPNMLAAWRTGADVVNMRRRSRDDESWRKRTAATWFYRIINWLSDVPIPADVGDFRLFSRRAADAMIRLQERGRFTKGLASWIGFKQVTLEFDVRERLGGDTKWRMRQLWHFAVEGITAFSIVPLRLASHVGMAAALAAFAAGLYFLFKTLVYGDPVQGFPTLIVVVLMLGGLQLLAIGVLGEYLGRIAMESKRRPLFLVQSYERARVAADVHLVQEEIEA